MSKIKIAALGGLNEIGKNMYLVDVDDKIYIFDAGSKYADDKLFGVDYIIPNFDYLISNKDRIVGIFITHGSDEQIGALADIINEIPEIKIYAGKFTLEIIKQELEESGISKYNLIEVHPHKKISFEKESIFAIQVSYSLPDSFLYVLNTSDGAIVFTGNYIFDPTMLNHYTTDIGKLAYVGKQGVLCLMNESVYAEKLGFTSPKHRASKYFSNILDENDGRILINLFDNQLFKIQELFDEVSKTSRNVVIVGKALESIVKKGIELGYIKFDAERIKTISHVSDPNVIVIISNDRQRPYSTLKRILRGADKFITLSTDDTVVIASPIVDSSEVTATHVFDSIAKAGANLIILSKKLTSLYASSEDIMMMIKLMNPKYYLPVMGEYRHQVENAKLAHNLNLPQENIILSLNGEVLTLVNGKRIDNGDTIKVDDILIDGNTSNDVADLVLKDREILSESGVVIVNANIDRATKTIINKTNITTKGFVYVKDNIDMIKEAEVQATSVINDILQDSNYIDFNRIKNGIRERLGKYFYKETESKPMILVIIQEI